MPSLVKKPFCLILLSLLTLFCLSACGLSGDKNGTNGRTANNSPGGSGSGNNEEDDLFVIKEVIGIRTERINGEINQLSSPEIQIEVIALNANFLESSSRSLPDYRVVKRENGGYEIQFDKVYEERINQVVKVTFNNNSTPKDILYAPLYSIASNAEFISVNAKSHYVLTKLFEQIDSTAELDLLLPCDSSGSCSHQDVAKANLLRQLNDGIANYPFEIPTTSTVPQAMTLLDQQIDLRNNVEAAIHEIIRTESPLAKGTRRGFDPLSAAGPYSQYYHTVLFGMGFSDIKPNDNQNTVSIIGMSSTIADSPTVGTAVSSNPYPGFDQTTSLYDLRKDILSLNIPYERTSLRVAQNNALILNDNENINFLTSPNTTDTHLSTQGFLLHERSFGPMIPSTSTDSLIGWEFNPLFTMPYQVNDFEPPLLLENRNDTPDYGNAPTWLTSSSYSKAASYSLSGTKIPYTRTEQLEDMHFFTWEINGLETAKDPGFSMSNMNGKQYGAISYSLKLDDNNTSKAMMLIAETAKWSISATQSAGTISISQPSNHYKTLSLIRSANNFTNGVRTEINLLESSKTISRQPSDNSSNPYHGLIEMSNPGPDKPKGHATANGSYLALAFNTKQKNDPLDRGQGIIIASELSTFNYQFNNETYLLQGNSLEMLSDKNVIHRFNGSSLIIEPAINTPNNNCIANLNIKRTSVEHILGTLENTITPPVETSKNETFSDECTIKGSELYITFSDIFGEPLTLRGFITQKNDAFSNSPGNLINLIWQQNNQLGLVFANKELELDPSFN